MNALHSTSSSVSKVAHREWLIPASIALCAIAGGAAMVSQSASPGRAWWTVTLAALCAISCGLLGCFLVLRRMSLLGDAISHAVLPGIAVAFLVTGRVSGLPILVGAMAVGMLTTFLTQSLRDYGRVSEDSSMGVVYTSLFALGVIMITRLAAHVDLDPGCVLYGALEMAALDTTRLFGIETPRAFATLGTATGLTLAFIVVLWKELKITSFDAALATAMGIKAGVVHYLLMAMVAGVTVASFEAVGSILVVAMLIVPGATAHLLTDRLGPMLVWSTVVSFVSALFGYALAVKINTSIAGMMAVSSGAQFLVAVLLAPRHGLVVRALGNLRLSLRIASEDVVAVLYRQEEAAALPYPTAASELGNETAGVVIASRWDEMLRRFAIPRLVRKGLVRRNAARSEELTLTDAGREVGRSIVRAHRLWESYLDRHFELPLDHVHAPAERMEHFLGPEMQMELAAQLEEPARDPHGRAIPPS